MGGRLIALRGRARTWIIIGIVLLLAAGRLAADPAHGVPSRADPEPRQD